MTLDILFFVYSITDWRYWSSFATHPMFFCINTNIKMVNRKHATSAPVKHVNTKCHISDVIRTEIGIVKCQPLFSINYWSYPCLIAWAAILQGSRISRWCRSRCQTRQAERWVQLIRSYRWTLFVRGCALERRIETLDHIVHPHNPKDFAIESSEYEHHRPTLVFTKTASE